MTPRRRIMVDLSACLLHHGHVRLLAHAAELGTVVVGLTSDAEVRAQKGIVPELSFAERKEILAAIRFVDEVVEVPWLIDEAVLDRHAIDLLVHGSDNANPLPAPRLHLTERTTGVSSSDLRARAAGNLFRQRNRERRLLTPGPAHILPEAVLELRPVFGRGDAAYEAIYERVTRQLLAISGQDRIACVQGSATLAIEIAVENFVRGRVLLIDTGFYGQRLAALLRGRDGVALEVVDWTRLAEVGGAYDWVVAVSVETSRALKLDHRALGAAARRVGAKLMVDATASIGLEDDHGEADLVAFSSCKGLCGLAGGAFVAFKHALPFFPAHGIALDLRTHLERGVTGPYHAVCSLAGTLPRLDVIRRIVAEERERFVARYPELLVWPAEHRPLLCTQLSRPVALPWANAVSYTPRLATDGMIVCHLPVALDD
jgi:2-aminoethylphosphonate-pyruvate transaminase